MKPYYEDDAVTLYHARLDLREGVMAELLECYGEGENTDWPYLNDLRDLIVSMIEKHHVTDDAWRDMVYERDHRIRSLQADNHRLRAAIGRHRTNVMSLGHNVDRRGNEVWGSEWDRDLWAVLYDFANKGGA